MAEKVSLGPKLGCLRGGVVLAKSNCSSYPHIFCSGDVLETEHWKPGLLPKLFHGSWSKMVFPRGSQIVAQRGHCSHCSWDQGVYAYYLMHRWDTPGFLGIWHWTPQLPQGHFCLWTLCCFDAAGGTGHDEGFILFNCNVHISTKLFLK